jgi:Domain of unknown function (DUF4157)
VSSLTAGHSIAWHDRQARVTCGIGHREEPGDRAPVWLMAYDAPVNQRGSRDNGGVTTESRPDGGTAGKRTLTEGLPVQMKSARPQEARAVPDAPVQQKAAETAGDKSDATAEGIGQIAQAGVRDGGGSLPHLDTIQRSFGPAHDLSAVSAHQGGDAASASAAIGAKAYTTGSQVAFREAPDLRLAAHEAAHVVQQRGGVQLAGGVGAEGDPYEQHADAVADRVVAGESAADLLAGSAGAGPGASASAGAPVQMEREGELRTDPTAFLRANVLSLTMDAGMAARVAAKDPVLSAAHSPFISKLGTFDRHWFKLVPDAGRTKEDQGAYILTPAIEKYVEQYPEDELLQTLRERPGLPPVEGDDAYLLSAFVEYKNIGVKNPDETVGHTDVTRDRDAGDDFNPDLVFTAAMNGCAFTITPSATEGKFTAWHFQSPTSNRAAASEFRQDKNPSDWYGAEEYDKGNHDGLFEVTNFLHRGQDNQWSVISQQNEASAFNPNQVAIRDVEQRPLNVDQPPDRAGMLKRIYRSMQDTKAAELQRAVTNARKYEARLTDKIRLSLKMLSDGVGAMLAEEQRYLEGAGDLDALVAVAKDIRKFRAGNAARITEACDSLRKHIDEKHQTESKSWFKDDKLLKDLLLCGDNLEAVGRYVGQIEWANELQAEASKQ